MIANRAFRDLIALGRGLAPVEVTPDFRALLADGLVDVEGAVLLRCMFTGDALPPIRHHLDRTGYECVINKFHVEDFMDRSVGREPVTLAAFAMRYAELLSTLLARFSADTFRIIGNVNGRASTLRFHKLRDGESWLVDDLEGYREEAVFYFDQPPGPLAGDT